MEIPLCGHATLASSKILFEKNSQLTEIHFVNVQNLDLIIWREKDTIVMTFPTYETKPQSAPAELLKALGIEKIINSVYNKETNILLLEIEDSQILRGLNPDFEKLVQSHTSINGCLLYTSPSPRDATLSRMPSSA